jgi:DNA-binding transcriptional MerR regulator
MMDIWTTKTVAKVLGIKQDTLKHYAIKFGIGSQPGGSGTPWFFTKEDLLAIRNRAEKREKIEMQEDREALGLGALYNPDKSPRR